MEHKNPSKTLASHTIIILFLLLSSNPEPILSQPLHSEPIFSQSQRSPNPSPPFNATTTTHSPTIPLRRVLLGILFGSLAGLFAAIALLFLIHLFLLFANRTPILHGPVVFSRRFSSKTIQLALSSQCQPTQSLGSSSIGYYYRVVLDDELIVAVKILQQPNCPNASPVTNSNYNKRRVQHELELLAKVKHRNVMNLKAYVRDRDRFSLVYDYCPHGSLEDAMKRVRAQQLSMGWEVRHRIAVGIAKGLRYLHFECIQRILHYGLKPANVLLDEEFEPRLGDCGLMKLVAANVDLANACYSAPECFQSCRYTDKSDIFSFGMILSVLLTGRDPSDPFFATESGRGSLGRWLRHLQQSGEAREALDKGILGEEVEEDEMLMAIRIALVCLSDLPADRPSSDELVAMLTQLHSF